MPSKRKTENEKHEAQINRAKEAQRKENLIKLKIPVELHARLRAQATLAHMNFSAFVIQTLNNALEN